MSYVFLLFAIICEVIGTSFLPKSNGFKNLVPSVISVTAYCMALYFMSISAREIPISILYAIWAGLGIVLIALIGVFVLGQKLDIWGILGIILITAGVIVIKTLSKSTI